MVKSVHELEAYNSAYALALNIHKISLKFPKEEQFALSSQIRRSSKSICANLAEGFAKSHLSAAEFKRFAGMALGSAEETRVWLNFARDLGYISNEYFDDHNRKYETICRQINGL